jgi:hypothetical protein
MLGESGGRSAGNPPRASARRRMSDDERGHYTHLRDDPQAWADDAPALHGWRAAVHSAVVATAACGWSLFLAGAAELADGWLAMCFRGALAASAAGLALYAFSNRSSS